MTAVGADQLTNPFVTRTPGVQDQKRTGRHDPRSGEGISTEFPVPDRVACHR